MTLANQGATRRSSVVRNAYSREIEMVPDHERSTRLYRQFRHLHAGLTVVGTPEHVKWRLLPQLALDGMNPGQRAVIEFLMGNPAEHSTAVVAGHCRLPETPVRSHLQDFTAHCAVNRTGDHPERWAASPWLYEHWWAVTQSSPKVVAPR